jgi:hypothetical protein
MTTQKLRQSLGGVLGIIFLMSLVACAYAPPHPHHAHYHAYDYYYYPSMRVYFRYSTGYYYYPSGTVWIKTRRLPPKYRLDQRDRVIIRIEKDKPYARHHKHQEKYRPHPDYRSDPYRDEKERYYNQKQYEKYRKKE